MACDRRAGRIDGGEANVASERICAVGSLVFDIHSTCGRVIHGYLHGRVANDEVPADDVSVSSQTQHDPIGIPAGDIELNDVVVGGEVPSLKTDAKVPALTCVAISENPVRTEPGAAGAAKQSYAAAGKGTISVSY